MLGLRMSSRPHSAHFNLARTGAVRWRMCLCSIGWSSKVSGTSLRPPQCAQASSRLPWIRLTTVSSYLTACPRGCHQIVATHEGNGLRAPDIHPRSGVYRVTQQPRRRRRATPGFPGTRDSDRIRRLGFPR